IHCAALLRIPSAAGHAGVQIHYMRMCRNRTTWFPWPRFSSKTKGISPGTPIAEGITDMPVERQVHFEEDLEWVRRSRNGDQAAFGNLVRKYHRHLLNLVFWTIGRSSCVEDVVQEILLRVYFSLDSFNDNRPFYPWLRRVALNRCCDELRALQRCKTRTFTELSLPEVENVEKTIYCGTLNP
ncbi:MAG: RNA polymerase sigma factor, partial [Acidobacteriota bacterium]